MILAMRRVFTMRKLEIYLLIIMIDKRESARNIIIHPDSIVALTKSKLKNTKKYIPGYSHYEVLFEPCDRFNRKLHDRAWSYKRDGRKVKGGPGCLSVFLFASIL